MNLGNRHSQHSFSKTPDIGIQRSAFNRSSSAKDAFYFDTLVPIYVDEVLPGDTMNLTANIFARLSTQQVPIMDNLYIDFFFFYVPNRLLWQNWERFMGAQDNPGDSIDYILPSMTAPAGGFGNGTMQDSMGIPTQVAGLVINNTLPFRAYNLIWNTWFRDENLDNSIPVPLGNGPDTPGDFVLRGRNKRHDYFTSALPWPQKGPNVTIPIAATAPVVRTNNAPEWVAYKAGTNTPALSGVDVRLAPSGPNTVIGDTVNGISLNPNGGLQATLGSSVAGTINQLREAFQMQSLFERDARSGTRYIEILRGHFNVISPDFRLQRPEYLGGGQTRINSHPVASSAETTEGPIGKLGAFATASSQGQSIGFTKSFVEHGYVIGLACARADITYQQGMNRLWNRRTRYDYFWPELANLGEQAILNKEIYAQGTAADNNVFGYQERYAEYRYKPSEIRGAFRSNFAQSLDMWHMADEYGGLPALNALWIKQSTPIQRALVVTTEAPILMDMFFQLNHARPMPTYSIPASLGRF